MPRRTNLEQAAIFYAKQHFATDDVTVEESKMWLDPESGVAREADIVIETVVLGTPVVISIEVKAEKRPLTLPTVEAMINKHERLPTTTLVLVSWSGFTKPALAKVAAQGGWVVALTPEPLPNATMPDLFYEEWNSTPENAALIVRDHDGALMKVVDVPIGVHIYDAPLPEALLCTLQQLTLRILNGESGENMVREAHDHPDQDSLHFSMELADLDQLFKLYVHDGHVFRRLAAFDVTGPIGHRRQLLDFTVMKLGEDLFAFTEVQMAGRDAVWVLTPKDDQSATVSWRLL